MEAGTWRAYAVNTTACETANRTPQGKNFRIRPGCHAFPSIAAPSCHRVMQLARPAPSTKVMRFIVPITMGVLLSAYCFMRLSTAKTRMYANVSVRATTFSVCRSHDVDGDPAASSEGRARPPWAPPGLATGHPWLGGPAGLAGLAGLCGPNTMPQRSNLSAAEGRPSSASARPPGSCVNRRSNSRFWILPVWNMAADISTMTARATVGTALLEKS
mmetsp:Transcript_6864/g.19339  ORF Transcript_6864/g.19339 Transcript_6864/m.19339 type:complete len:216 (+) Transcript_6864:990-1637(+)